MKRDFSEEAKKELLDLVAEVEEEEWCDATDWLGDRWLDFEDLIGKLDIKNYIDNVDAYHKKVFDKNNTTASKIESIFTKVNEVNQEYQAKFALSLTNLQLYKGMIDSLADTVLPGNGKFDAEYIGNGLKKNIENYLEDSKGLQVVSVEGLSEDEVIDLDEMGMVNIIQKYADVIADNLSSIEVGEEFELPLGFGITFKFSNSVQVEGGSEEEISIVLDAQNKKIKELQFIKKLGEDCSIGYNSEDGIVVNLGDMGLSMDPEEGVVGTSLTFEDGDDTYTVSIGASFKDCQCVLEIEIEISTAIEGGSVTSTYAIEYKPEGFKPLPQPEPVPVPYLNVSAVPEYDEGWSMINVGEALVAGGVLVTKLVENGINTISSIGNAAYNTIGGFMVIPDFILRMQMGLEQEEMIQS